MLRRCSMDHLPMRIPTRTGSRVRFTLYANSSHHLDDNPRESLHSKTRALISACVAGGWQMARVRHITLVTDDPAKTPEFYKKQFGLTDLYPRPSDTPHTMLCVPPSPIHFPTLQS